MDPPDCTQPQLSVLVCRAEDENFFNPKFSFQQGQDKHNHFTLTRQSLCIQRYIIHCESCRCLEHVTSNSKKLWRVMFNVARECFWIVTASLRNSVYLKSTFRLIEYDVPLCFDAYGLLLLSVEKNESFLHINSGSGYACTLAAHLIGPHGVNHGVEFRAEYRNQARFVVKQMLRLCPESQATAALPLYHENFPLDLLEGKSKFDKILITDCFRNLDDIYELKRLLTPNGVLVTSLVRKVEDEWEISMLMLVRQAGRDDDWCTATHMFHFVKPGMFRRIIRVIYKKKFNTLSRLTMARLNPVAPPESAMPSLKTLSLRLLSRRTNPIRHLLGESEPALLLRVPEMSMHIPHLSDQLEYLIAAFESFRIKCLSIEMDAALEAEVYDSVEEKLAKVALALEALGKKFVGEQKYSLWKNGRALELSVQQGVMVWILENIFHLVRFRWNFHSFSCSVDLQCIFLTIQPNWEAFTHEISNVIVMKPLLNAFHRAFHSADLRRVVKNAPPWSYHLSYAKQIRRTLTKLAARFWADVQYLIYIVRAMLKFCEDAREEPFWVAAVLAIDITDCQVVLNSLKDDALHHSVTFCSMQVIQERFSGLIQHVRGLQDVASFIMRDYGDIEAIQDLAYCLRFVGCSVARNLVGSGGVRNCTDHYLKLMFVSVEGQLMDSDVFNAELSCLVKDDFNEESPISDAFDFLVRRFMSDLKEALWMSEGLRADRTLCRLEEDPQLYLQAVLRNFLSIAEIEEKFGNFAD